MTAGKRLPGATAGALALAALLALGALVVAPPLLDLTRSAAGLDGVREPYTHLSFADPTAAARGFPRGKSIEVLVGNETGAKALLLLVAHDEAANWRATLEVELADGEVRTVSFSPPPRVRQISVAIDGRDVLIRAAVRP